MTASSHTSRTLSYSLVFVVLLLLCTPLLAPAAVLKAPTVIGGCPVEAATDGMMTVRGKGPVRDLAASGKLLVSVSPAASPEALQAMLNRTGCKVLHKFRAPGQYLLKLPARVSVRDGVSRLKGEGIVRRVEPDRVIQIAMTPNDEYYDQQYHWPLIMADRAWDGERGSSAVTVAVIDNGFDNQHPDLFSRLWYNSGETAGNNIDDDLNLLVDDRTGWDFLDDDNDPRPEVTTDDWIWADRVSHGTHVAGLIGAASDNGVGVAGHDWNCRLMNLRVADNYGYGYSDELIQAIEYATAKGANVICLSLDFYYYYYYYGNSALQDAINAAYNAGIIVVAAAGNNGAELGTYSYYSLACYDGYNLTDNHVLGVGATDSLDQLWESSNRNSLSSTHRYVDVMAPGVDVYSTLYYDPANDFLEAYGPLSGTSAACGITAGLAALMKAHYPTESPDSIINRIRDGCVDIDLYNPDYVGMMGAGRICSAEGMGNLPPAAVRNLLASDTLGDNGGSITVTWSLSLDDGRGSNDVVNYEIFRGSAIGGPFQSLGTVPAGTKSFTDTDVVNYTDYYYQVTASDGTGVTPSRVSDAAQARDDLPPPAVALTAADTVDTTGGSISLSWTGYAVPTDFGKYHVYRSTSSFTNVSDMTPIKVIASSSTKVWDDKTVVDDTDYYYAVTCLDSSQPANEDRAVTCAGPVRSNPNFAFGYPIGLSLVGIGLSMPEAAPASVFDLSHGARLARWEPSSVTSGSYHVYDAAADDLFLYQAPGRGFWLRSYAPMSLNLSGSAVTAPRRVDFAAGWNQLGNPYVGDVDVTATEVRIGGTSYTLDQSNENGYTRNYMWGYNSGSGSYKLISPGLPFSTPLLAKGQGYFFLAERAGQIILPYPGAATTEQVAQKSEPLPVAWSLRLVAATEGVADTDNFLGVSSQAAAVSGIQSPPPVIDGFDLYFPVEGVRTATAFVKSLDSDHVWTAEVSCTRPNAAVKLSWPDLSGLPRECRPLLKDTVSGATIYMRTAGAYSFTLGPGETKRQFTIDISPKAGDLLAIRTLQTGNAANGAQVSYTLSAAATVDVDLVNLAGRVVRHLQSAAVAAGPQTVAWNGASDTGTAVPAGSYLVRLTARSDSGQAVTAVQPLSWRR